MEGYLVLNADREISDDLIRLKGLVPPELVRRAEVHNTQPGDEGDPPPRWVARVAKITELEAEQVRQALCELKIDDVELVIGPLSFAPFQSDSEPESDGMFCGYTDQELSTAEVAMRPIAEVLTEVMKAERTDIDYPELSYSGDHEAAYLEFVRRLNGREPRIDKGAYLFPNDVKAAADKPPWRKPRKLKVWHDVAEHLEREVRFFHFATDWFGSAGYVRNMLQDQQVFDSDFVRRLNDNYLKIAPKTSVTVDLDTAMGFASKAAALIPGYGKLIGALISATWTVTRTQIPDSSTKFEAAITQCHDKVAETFLASIKVTEKADTALAEDWGLIDRFGSLIEDQHLSWPRDLSKLRATNARAFHFTILRDTLRLKSEGNTMTYNSNFGVIRRTVKVRGKQAAKWDKFHFKTASKYHKGCCGVRAGWYLDEFYLGTVTLHYHHQPATTTYTEAAPELQRKMFGKNQSSETDPQFKLPSGFLVNLGGKSRKGWSLRTYG